MSSLLHVSDFKVMERRVIEVVERSPREQPETGLNSRFQAEKGDAALRTCVYSRYAGQKNLVFRGFHRSQVTTGLAVDCRQNHQENSFWTREVAATISTCTANKITYFLNLED